MTRLACLPESEVKVAQLAPCSGRVEKIEEMVPWLTKRGAEFENYPFIQDYERRIWTAPGGDKIAWFKDPDGNVLSISTHQ